VNVDEALAIADRPNDYTSLQQAVARSMLADAVRNMRREHELQEAALAAEVRALRDAVTETRRRHTPDARMGHDDVRCSSCQEESWPCATVRLLGGTEVGS
jgi:hypothetical protein